MRSPTVFLQGNISRSVIKVNLSLEFLKMSKDRWVNFILDVWQCSEYTPLKYIFLQKLESIEFNTSSEMAGTTKRSTKSD